MRKIAGIDYSLTSPAICVWKSVDDRLFDFDSCDLYYLENSPRWKSTTATSHGLLNLHPEEYPEWNTEEERHAFATVGKSHVRSVAENTGLLKHKMYKVKQKFSLIPPTVIKKYATGKGNANKEVMYDTFTAELVTPSDLKLRLTPKSKKLSNPVTDIVDAYWICKYGWEGFIE